MVDDGRLVLPAGTTIAQDKQGAFDLTDVAGDVVVGRFLGDIDDAAMERFLKELLPLVDARPTMRMLMDVRAMKGLAMGARYRVASFMKAHKGRIRATAVVVRDPSQRFMLQVVLRVTGRMNVRAVTSTDEAHAFFAEVATQ